MKKNIASKTGFTLIELLVVIAIIALLASIVLASMNNARQKSRDVRRISDFRQIALAQELYYDNNRYYPSVTLCTAANYTGTLTTALSGTYITGMPADPLNSGSNIYMYGTDVTPSAQRYVLRAYLELHHSGLDTDIDGTVYSCSCGTQGASEREYCLQP